MCSNTSNLFYKKGKQIICWKPKKTEQRTTCKNHEQIFTNKWGKHRADRNKYVNTVKYFMLAIKKLLQLKHRSVNCGRQVGALPFFEQFFSTMLSPSSYRSFSVLTLDSIEISYKNSHTVCMLYRVAMRCVFFFCYFSSDGDQIWYTAKIKFHVRVKHKAKIRHLKCG